MSNDDRALGMGRAITRRDFIQGTLAAAAVGTAASGLAASAQAATKTTAPLAARAASASDYPPLRSGMRGAHPGAFEAAHALRDGASFDAGAETGETYDLVVVGAGLSGLAAAYAYRKRAGASARILLIDNHDDFGGHAKRNEFDVDGQQLIVNGGSEYLVAPSTWSPEAWGLIRDLGLDQAGKNAGDFSIYGGNGSGEATFFRSEAYGRDALVRGGTPLNPTPAFLADAPLPQPLKDALVRLHGGTTDYLAGLDEAAKIARLQSISYRDYLLEVAKFPPEVLPYTMGVWCLGNDMCSAWFAFFRHAPGFDGLGLRRPDASPESPEHARDDFALPAGNSDIARLIVRQLIPDALPPGDYISVEGARVDYATLDRPGQATRIRLSSIVLRAQHVGQGRHARFDPDTSEVQVSYITAGKLFHVRAKDVVMAGMNNVIPYLCPELPEAQKAALHQAVRAVNQVTNVVLRNWQPFDQLGLRSITTPRAFFGRFALQRRSLGNFQPVVDPSRPIVATFMTGKNSGICSNETMVETMLGASLPPGMPMDDQFRAVRAGLLATPFETFEREVRRLASGALAGTSFDPARDILGITVNRWPHGFATGRNSLFDDVGPGSVSPTVLAKQRFGRIAIANSDASGQGLASTAFDEAFRAVRELERHDYGYYETF
ncbi:spermidine dehydrogenase [Pseudoxanthomonas sp. GM95]|uniref:NAD(P)-binding protein n=1 Tax=Pseudoxanthomonas sp. GM95 TaxID=1881043 RepID=UPI0008AD3C6E|nr:FAD/NAD(P)-binding protein [Pseudoxanthomonas sp. GM95]SEL60787.1 spermidine dehydrogenase [Pseudoxanthomonas sp. GM95]